MALVLGSTAALAATSSSTVCDRTTAVTGFGDAAHAAHAGHHNHQLVLLGLSIMLLGGAGVQHYLGSVPLPYTMLLLVFGWILGLWVLFDADFTLQPGMRAGEHSWGTAVLQCNVSNFIPNDLFNHGWHFGNSVRLIAEMDPHLLLHVLLPPLLFESAFAIDWHIFQKVSGYALFLALVRAASRKRAARPQPSPHRAPNSSLGDGRPVAPPARRR